MKFETVRNSLSKWRFRFVVIQKSFFHGKGTYNDFSSLLARKITFCYFHNPENNFALQFDINNWLAIGDEGKLGIVFFSYMYFAFLSFSCDNVIRHLHISHNAPYWTPLFI